MKTKFMSTGLTVGVLSIASVLFFLLFSPAQHEVARAGSGDNLMGFAWSSNVGWISLNSANCDADFDGQSDASAPAGCPSAGVTVPQYGVALDTDTGIFSGYAWSDNIGWIDFAPGSGYPSTPNQDAQRVGSDIVGWVKAVSGGSSESGNWDGWIKLSGSWSDGVTVSGNDIVGYAWGGDVVGWISFNADNCDPDNDGLSEGVGSCPSSGTPVPDYGVTLAIPGTLVLDADPLITTSGSPVTLSWTTTNMNTCTAAGDWSGSKSVNGTFTEEVTPVTNAVYTLDCVDDLAQPYSDSVVVQVYSANAVTLTVDKQIVRQGESVVLSWDTGGIPEANCTFTGPQVTPIASTTGSQNVTMNSTNTFTLDCVASSASLNVNVVPAIEEN